MVKQPTVPLLRLYFIIWFGVVNAFVITRPGTHPVHSGILEDKPVVGVVASTWRPVVMEATSTTRRQIIWSSLSRSSNALDEKDHSWQEQQQPSSLGIATVSDENRQAGTDGYSVMRQPLSQANWDPNASPENEVPSSLRDEDKFMGIGGVAATWKDEEWWARSSSGRSVGNDVTRSRRPNDPMPPSSERRKEPEMEEELNLFKRTFDTLDYPRIVLALSQAYASTLPARNILNDRQPKSRQRKNKQVNGGAAASEKRAFQPFLATHVDEARERYRAVEELQWILEGRTNTGVVLPSDYYFRNRRGYKESLVGRMIPLADNSFALGAIMEAAATGGLVLESPQLFEISSSLDRLRDIQSWGQALTKVDEVEFVELPKLVDCIQVNETLQELLHNALDEEGRLSGVTFPTVGRVRAQVKALRGDILKKLDSLVQMPSIQSKLALDSGGPLFSEINGGRLVIPLQASDSKRQASSVGIVHDMSRSGKTVYV